MRPEGGGVQRCTREYLRAVSEAGAEVEVLTFRSDMRWHVRALRKLTRFPYRHEISPKLEIDLKERLRRDEFDWILFNHCNGLPALSAIGESFRPRTKVGFLSHGLDSTDEVHYRSVGNLAVGGASVSSADSIRLGRQIYAERSFLVRCDFVACLAPTDVEIHRWLGANNVIHLPRVVESKPLDWMPVEGRFGTVATLEHAPNLQGITALCDSLKTLATSPFTLRIVGRPETIGRELARRYRFVEYLGPISDAALTKEAQSWIGFANPIFIYPRGCSTKLSVPLEWGIPIHSSRAGARGYYWDEVAAPLADTACQLASSMISAEKLARAASLREGILQISGGSPSWKNVGDILRLALNT